MDIFLYLRNDREDLMLMFLVFLLLLIVIDIAAMRWGFNSSDGPDSKEWERRQQYAWLRECSENHSARGIAGGCLSE